MRIQQTAATARGQFDQRDLESSVVPKRAVVLIVADQELAGLP
jgi:hypothetical protein